MGLPEASSTLPEIDADTCPHAGAAMRAANQRRGVQKSRLRCAALTALFPRSPSGRALWRGRAGDLRSAASAVDDLGDVRTCAAPKSRLERVAQRAGKAMPRLRAESAALPGFPAEAPTRTGACSHSAQPPSGSSRAAPGRRSRFARVFLGGSQVSRNVKLQ